MVGFGVNASGPSPDHFVIHDPAPRTGMSYTDNYVLPTALTTGTITGGSSGLPRSAAGLYKLTGWPISSNGNSAILNGAFVVELAPVTNFAPVAVADEYDVIKNRSITRSADLGFLTNDTDANGDPFLPTLLSTTAHGTLSTDYLGGFTYTPAAGYFGMDSFTYRLNDTLGNSNVATVTFNVAPPVPGDANYDGTVDDLDAQALAQHWLHHGAIWDHGDFTGDGLVDDRDAAILAAHWVRGTENASVPEPNSFLLLLTGVVAIGLMFRGRP